MYLMVSATFLVPATLGFKRKKKGDQYFQILKDDLDTMLLLARGLRVL